tara:strand:- start:120 stop:1133 length:1014 start_codon:yes stop_codon:yes gene_type:complete
MTLKIGINGFGRMGRLALRVGWDCDDIQFHQINDPAGDAATFAHLLNFDSVHGRWHHEASADSNQLVIEGNNLSCSANQSLNETDWSGCDIVIEASGVMRDPALLQAYLDQGVKRVVVTAPVKSPEVVNIVYGINDDCYDPDRYRLITAASCTTNCLAPIVKVVHETFGIKHGSMTTIHDITNTQRIIDAPHKDLRRTRSCGSSLIPTTTGSATAITEIFPELKGRLNGHAVRVPLTNASLVDAVFELNQPVDATQVNQAFEAAAKGPLKGILGYETRPLVSIDYKTDPRSAIIDALSTMVINETQLKVYAWYDNEWGYVNRTIDLVRKVARLESKA